jgi:hypothetical protein
MKLDGFDPRFLEWLKGQGQASKDALEDAWANADAAPGHRNEGYARRTAVIAQAKQRGFVPPKPEKGRR